jgi:hypothetical protein
MANTISKVGYMPQLTAIAFRIQNYRNIDDSGWIELERVTDLVGRNESGKTALLQALHKFNPARALPYVPQREFPRDRFTRDFKNAADWPVSSVRFKIEGDLRFRLAAITAPNPPPELAEITKFYDGRFEYSFEPELKEIEIPANVVLSAIGTLSDAAMGLAAPAPEQEATYTAIRKELLDWTTDAKDKITPHLNLKVPQGAAALKTIHDEGKAKGRPETADIIKPFVIALAAPLAAAGAPPVRGRVIDEIKKSLPVFIYFDNYGALDSAIYLPRLLEDVNTPPPKGGGFRLRLKAGFSPPFGGLRLP